ncbi:MAG: hypothetical protein EU530_10845 [Promethearchaeota archaeon]|nr:MAG: hypothetical protein EU530_10845 [Candidatus Lokiarchaeota archaeon]
MKIAEQKLRIASQKLEVLCSELIIEKKLDLTLRRLRYVLIDTCILYIQYNNYGEYSYSIIYSSLERDLARFDNHDAHWNVDTSPHHFHPRNQYEAVKSPMKGVPSTDMEELSNFLKFGS